MKIFIVDDHQLFRMGIRLALTGKPDVEIVGEAGTGRDLFVALESQTPDIVLLDILLPDMSGLEIAKKLKEENPEIKILILSAESPEAIVEEVLKIGIEGYVSKSTNIQEIEDALYSVDNGLEYFGRDISKVIYDVVVAKKKQNENSPVFTPRELEIIRLCSDGLLSKEIADQLQISYRTVENHKNNIFKKLGINNSVELARYAILNGLLG
ncbi:MAG: response regulator transcription factor [Bacteroidales bacterium]|jgi:DNA-binding NarL/FixJ family response regulator|nr:response regulator transcription factor [Bacteroidales bacterium]